MPDGGGARPTRCRCEICRLDSGDVEAMFEETVVYAIGVRAVKRLVYIAKMTMLD